MAIAATMPRMATVIINSINVKPFFTTASSRSGMGDKRDDLRAAAAGRTVEHCIDVLPRIETAQCLVGCAVRLDAVQMMGNLDLTVERRRGHFSADHGAKGAAAPSHVGPQAKHQCECRGCEADLS